MGKTNIQWADMSWNPVVGCTRVSAGCANCYAEATQRRWWPKDQPAPARWFPGNDTVTLHPERLNQPLRWKTAQVIFVCSMADLFHQAVPDQFIRQVFDVMASEEVQQHSFLLLTKRPERMAELAPTLPWPANIWAGTSVESQFWANRRIPFLLSVPARVRFISAEPLLRPLNLSCYLDELQWVIVGGESGPRARPMAEPWVREIRADCRFYKVPFFFKQWGGRTPDSRGRLLDGLEYNEMPKPPGQKMLCKIPAIGEKIV